VRSIVTCVSKFRKAVVDDIAQVVGWDFVTCNEPVHDLEGQFRKTHAAHLIDLNNRIYVSVSERVSECKMTTHLIDLSKCERGDRFRYEQPSSLAHALQHNLFKGQTTFFPSGRFVSNG
jgi:23S rRNA A1618 N6-methylase RlmF